MRTWGKKAVNPSTSRYIRGLRKFEPSEKPSAGVKLASGGRGSSKVARLAVRHGGKRKVLVVAAWKELDGRTGQRRIGHSQIAGGLAVPVPSANSADKNVECVDLTRMIFRWLP